MDERQQQIKEGAGLEETRINQDLIDFLNKWSTPFLVVLLLAVGAYWGWGKYQDYKIGQVNEAFNAYEAAIAGGNPSPDSLRQVAETYEGIRAVSSLANLTTADLYLRAATLGLRPGSSVDPVTNEFAEGDVLDEQDVRGYLESAAGLYAGVLEQSERKERWLLATNAALGLAAANASLERTSEAESALARAREAAEKAGYTDLATAIEPWKREIMPEGGAGSLYTNDDLPQAALPEVPAEGIEGEDGETVEPVVEEVVPLPGTEVVPEDSVVPGDPAEIPDEPAADEAGEQDTPTEP